MATYSVYDILERIRPRPAMYTGTMDLDGIHTFLSGYSMAMEEAGISESSEPEFSLLNEFVRKRFGFGENTAGWANMIKAVSLGYSPKAVPWSEYDEGMTDEQHKSAMALFYELLDEFRANAV